MRDESKVLTHIIHHTNLSGNNTDNHTLFQHYNNRRNNGEVDCTQENPHVLEVSDIQTMAHTGNATV